MKLTRNWRKLVKNYDVFYWNVYEATYITAQQHLEDWCFLQPVYMHEHEVISAGDVIIFFDQVIPPMQGMRLAHFASEKFKWN